MVSMASNHICDAPATVDKASNWCPKVITLAQQKDIQMIAVRHCARAREHVRACERASVQACEYA